MAAKRTFPLLSERRPGLVEWMDRLDCDPVKLRNTYRYFPVINRLISRWNAVYRHQIRPMLNNSRRYSLLDVGSGGGDITRSIHAWAASDGYQLDVTGIDPDPRAHEYAMNAVGSSDSRNNARNVIGISESDHGGNQRGDDSIQAGALQFLRADTGQLRRDARTFDFVICNHVLHHLSDESLPGFLDDLSALADRRVVCSDIERSAIGYGLFSVATWPLFPNSFIRADGLISIRKSYRAAELREAAPSGWKVIRQFPFRLLLIFDKESISRQGGNQVG